MSITLFILIFTCLVSILAFNRPEYLGKYAHFPYAEKRNREYHRILTSGFLHGNAFHLFVNMFVLWAFGEYIEHRFIELKGAFGGRILFFLFYLFMIILAGLPGYAKHQDNPRYSSIGASGATSAIVFSYILFHPLSMLELYFFIPIPAIVFGVLYLWYSNWASRKLEDRIDHDAHFYGAIAGFLFTALLDFDLLPEFFDQLTEVL